MVHQLPQDSFPHPSNPASTDRRRNLIKEGLLTDSPRRPVSYSVRQKIIAFTSSLPPRRGNPFIIQLHRSIPQPLQKRQIRDSLSLSPRTRISWSNELVRLDPTGFHTGILNTSRTQDIQDNFLINFILQRLIKGSSSASNLPLARLE